MAHRTFLFFQAEDGIRDGHVTGVQTCALPISVPQPAPPLYPPTWKGRGRDLLGWVRCHPPIRFQRGWRIRCEEVPPALDRGYRARVSPPTRPSSDRPRQRAPGDPFEEVE